MTKLSEELTLHVYCTSLPPSVGDMATETELPGGDDTQFSWGHWVHIHAIYLPSVYYQSSTRRTQWH